MATLYRKKGRLYQAVGEEVFVDTMMREGTHLVIVEVGKRTILHNIDPAYAELIAAGVTAQDAMVKAMLQISKTLSPVIEVPLTDEQKLLVSAMQDSGLEPRFTKPSFYDIAQAGVDALIEVAKVIDAKAEDPKESALG